MVIAQGQAMLAADMLNLVFFPKGTILMYDGTSWSDNVTLKGWYQCQGGSVNGMTIPDLRDKFIMGYNGARTGGTNSLTLQTTNLPSHSHPNGTLSVASGGEHTHTINDPGHRHLVGHAGGGGSGALENRVAILDYGHTQSSTTGISINTADSSHNHNITGVIGNTGNNTAFDNRPSYYALIYIIKVTPAGS